ncbi:MAG: SPOR domain-containing protein [Candidatus Adiutrix intracellularis]|nr:SPOR domain-containing protein [Candidatus Adiutrix intracellularis]
MNLLFIALGVFLILTIGLILNQGMRKITPPSNQPPRYRSEVRSSLNLDRPTRSRRKNSHPPTILVPILLGLVLLMLGIWLMAAYIIHDADPKIAEAKVPTATTDLASSPPQVGSLSGHLTLEEPPTTAPLISLSATKTVSAALPPPVAATPPTTLPVANAARAISPPTSSLAQVGLMPASQEPFKPVIIQSDLAQIASTSTNSTLSPTIQNNETILSGTKSFTIHLGSFSDKKNAEKYQLRLTATGESAYISETTNTDGRHWYRVMSGHFSTRSAADAHGRTLRSRGLTDNTGSYLVKPIN